MIGVSGTGYRVLSTEYCRRTLPTANCHCILPTITLSLRCIANNAGLDGGVVVNRVRQLKGKNDGYDADKDVYGDMVAAGIIDPAKVVRTALQNAASVASLLLTTESLICDIPKEDDGDDHAGHDHHGMGGGMGGMGGMDMGGMGGMGMGM